MIMAGRVKQMRIIEEVTFNAMKMKYVLDYLKMTISAHCNINRELYEYNALYMFGYALSKRHDRAVQAAKTVECMKLYSWWNGIDAKTSNGGCKLY